MTGVWQIVGIVVGVVLAGSGLAVVVLSRRVLRAETSHEAGGPTRLTVGLVCLFVGYHAVIWSLPAKWSMVSVPVDRWWVVLGVGVLALMGAGLAVWLEGRGG